MSFIINFDNGELEKLSKNLVSQGIVSTLIPDVNIAIEKFHSVLDTRVSTLYKVPTSLDSVRQKSSASTTGTLAMEYNLVYVEKPITLAKFKLNFQTLDVKNGIPFFDGRRFRYQPVNKAQSVRVTIKNSGTGAKSIKAKKEKYKKFYVKTIGEIFTRTTDKTWLQIPSPTPYSKGIRTPIKLLYGPSLATLASATYDNDPIVDTAKNTIVEDIFTAFTRNF